jgi:hypothetical protein
MDRATNFSDWIHSKIHDSTFVGIMQFRQFRIFQSADNEVRLQCRELADGTGHWRAIDQWQHYTVVFSTKPRVPMVCKK